MDELRARAYLDLLLGKDSRPRRETTAGGAGQSRPGRVDRLPWDQAARYPPGSPGRSP